MTFRKGEWALGRDGKYESVWCWLLVFSPVTRGSLPWLTTHLGRGFMGVKFLVEDHLKAEKGSSKKASPCICCFKCLQLRIIYQSGMFWGGVS